MEGVASGQVAKSGSETGSKVYWPLFGAMPGVPGLLLATGHLRNGVLLAPVAGAAIAGRRRKPPAGPGVVRRGYPPDRLGLCGPHPVAGARQRDPC